MRRLNWQTDRLDERFALILGADVVYERAQWEYLEPFWKAQLAEKRGLEEIMRLREQLAKRQEATAEEQMTATEKLQELEQQRIAGLQVLAESTNEKDRLKAQIGIEEINKRILDATKERDREDQAKKAGGRRAFDLTAHQRTGDDYAGDAIRTQSLDIHKKNEEHLKNIRGNMQTLVQRSGAGTQF